MSIKTLRKRIALVAVSALGVGLLSVAPASAADFAADDLVINAQAVGVNAGACLIGDGGQSGTFVTGSDVSLDSATADDYHFEITGPAVVVSTQGESITATSITDTDGTAADTHIIRLTGVGTVKIFAYVSAGSALVDTIVIKSVASCATGTFDADESAIETSTAEDDSPDGESGSTYTFVDEDIAYISIVGENPYSAALPNGVWTATANSGCLIDIDGTTAASTAISTNTDSVQATGTDVYVSVEQKTTGTAITCNVVVTYNGQTVYSKSILITGDLATLTVTGVDVQAAGGSTITDLYEVAAKDAAGNLLPQIVVTAEGAKLNSLVTAGITGYTSKDGSGNIDSDANDATPDGDGARWTCAATTGSTPMRLQATNNAAVVIYSNVFTAACGSTPSTYTASLDKAVYAPGDIATLTITAKDATGQIPYKNNDVESGGGAPDIAGSQMTAINTPVAGDKFDSAGVKKYTFTVGATEGKYNMQVSLGYTGNDARSVAYEVKATTAAVSNAEVLAAIVKLIASINAQIRALQKSLRR
jgi:hypothetical protein